MFYPSSFKNNSSSSAVVYPFKKRLLPFPEDLRISNNFPGDENRNIIRPQSFGLPPVTNYFNYYHYASGPMEMEIANIEFALELARSSVSILLINCRGRTAEFHLDRFISGGRGRCIRYNNQYFTPFKFVIDSGCDTDIEWSIAINYAGFYLRSLIRAGIIFVHQDDCECSKCRNYVMHDLDEVSAYRPIENSWQSSYEALDLRVKKPNENSENTNMGDPAKNVDRKYRRKQPSKVGRGEPAPLLGVAGLAPFSHNANSDIAFRKYWEAQARAREYQSSTFSESQNFASQNFASHSFASQNFASQNSASQNSASQNYAIQNSASQNSANQNFASQNFASQNFTRQTFTSQNFTSQNFASQNFAMGSYPRVTSTRVESGLSNNLWHNNAGPIDATYKACEERRLAAFRAAQAEAQARQMPSSSNMPFGQQPYGYVSASWPGPSPSDRSGMIQMHRIEPPRLVESSAKRRRMNPPSEQPSTSRAFRQAPVIQPEPIPSTSGMSVQHTEQLNGRNQDLFRYSGSSNNYQTHGRNGLRPLDQNMVRDSTVVVRDPGPSVAPHFKAPPVPSVAPQFEPPPSSNAAPHLEPLPAFNVAPHLEPLPAFNVAPHLEPPAAFNVAPHLEPPPAFIVAPHLEPPPAPYVAPQLEPPPVPQVDDPMPGPENLGVENIIEIITTAAPDVFIFRHADFSLHEYHLLSPKPSVPEDNVARVPNPEILITPPIEDEPAPAERNEQIVGEHMEVDEEVE